MPYTATEDPLKYLKVHQLIICWAELFIRKGNLKKQRNVSKNLLNLAVIQEIHILIWLYSA